MRIGELAALVGVSTRTVRHYHHLGLLPEPERLANGYREYRLRDAVALARVRRLAELGLSLEEIRDVLADARARSYARCWWSWTPTWPGSRRRSASGGPGSTVSPDMAAVLRDLTAGGSKFAAVDRELLTVMDMVAGPADRERVLDLVRPLTEPDALAGAHALYRRLDELADADPGDPCVPALAADLAAHIPDQMATAMITNLTGAGPSAPPADVATPRPESQGNAGGRPWLEAISEEMSPAQAEVFRLVVTILKARA